MVREQVSMDQAKLEALLGQATAHCYDEEDVFWGVFAALMRELSYPLQARMQGEDVTLVGLDGHTSDLQTGVIALVLKGDQERTVPLSGLEIVDPDPASAEWLATYRYWLGKASG
jgi:site-specific recombinase XerC